MVREVEIALGLWSVVTNLVVLPGLGLDVILGMCWMRSCGVTIDTINRIITLKDPEGGSYQLTLLRTIDMRGVSCATQTTNLSEIPVVNEFPDFFLMICPDYHLIEK
jgi:hypothetical protein